MGNNGTAYTSWVSLLTGAVPSTNTEAYVATNKAPGWTAYASVDYVLATPEVKTVQAEGGITLHPGGNQITVETGIIQRERAKLYLYNGKYYINADPSSKLSKRTLIVLTVYKGSEVDTKWVSLNHSGDKIATYGNMQVSSNQADVDPNANYYVTYIPLDKYTLTANVTQIDAQYARGISGVLSELAKAMRTVTKRTVGRILH